MSTTKRGRPNKGASSLNAEIILICAKELMAKDGAMPSIRKLANALNIDAMAIYYYYKNKAALLEAIAVSLIDEVCASSGQENWQEEVIELSFSYLTLLSDFPGLLETLLSMSSESPANAFADRFQTILTDLHISDEVKKHALDLLVDYLHGYALAMSCNQNLTLKENDISGPLNLMLQGISSHLKCV